MDVNDSRFEMYETRFRALAQKADQVIQAKPSLNASRYYLCLYGENGMSPDEEFTVLETMENLYMESLYQEELEKTSSLSLLKRLEVDTDYWQDTILFIP